MHEIKITIRMNEVNMLRCIWHCQRHYASGIFHAGLEMSAAEQLIRFSGSGFCDGLVVSLLDYQP